MYKGKRVICVTYGSRDYEGVANLNLQTAKEHGADEVIRYGSDDLPWYFYLRNCIHFMRYPQTAYWVWKPFVVLKTLRLMEDGEYLVYSDAASVYIQDISNLLEVFERDGLYLMTFACAALEREYSKGDAFYLLNARNASISDTHQRLGGFIVIKKCKQSVQFVKKWLRACENILIVWGNRNIFAHDYPEYIANRNDQTAFSILTKKAGINAYRDPSQYGNILRTNDVAILQRSTYPEMWYLYRDPTITSLKQIEELYEHDEMVTTRRL